MRNDYKKKEDRLMFRLRHRMKDWVIMRAEAGVDGATVWRPLTAVRARTRETALDVMSMDPHPYTTGTFRVLRSNGDWVHEYVREEP